MKTKLIIIGVLTLAVAGYYFYTSKKEAKKIADAQAAVDAAQAALDAAKAAADTNTTRPAYNPNNAVDRAQVPGAVLAKPEIPTLVLTQTSGR